MGNHYYLNEDHSYEPCDLMTWAHQIEDLTKNDKKHVACDIIDGFRVSTVWLGLNHNWNEGRPLLFETMIFTEDGAEDYQERYTTWEQAVKGHEEAIQWLKVARLTKP